MYPNPQDVLPLARRPDLERYRKRAKDLVKACRSAAPDAIRNWVSTWPGPQEAIERFARETLGRSDCALTGAQFVIELPAEEAGV